MAINWADNVNQRIIDSTQITIGEGGYVEDKGSNGEFKDRRLTSLAVPDSFNVVMDFDWLEKDANGMSEFDRFVTWYKYIHKRGTKPFYFPSITKFNINGSINPVDPITGETEMCQYKITSSLKPQKSGFSMRVTMTWEEVYSGPGIFVVPTSLAIDRMTVTNGNINCYFNHDPVTQPVVSDFTLQYKLTSNVSYTTATITNVSAVDGNMVTLSFDQIPAGNYFIKLTHNGISLYDSLGVN